ncbi:MAG: hydrogenase/urease maturation nickel metallochaperone HypA [Chloroflexota bacterium]
MHEVSLVAQLVDVCAERAAGRPVELVRVRHASTVPESVLRQAFTMLTEGSNLAAAALDTSAFDIRLRCDCGFDGSLGHDDLIDAVAAACPACGDVSPRAHTAEIELLEVRLAPVA